MHSSDSSHISVARDAVLLRLSYFIKNYQKAGYSRILILAAVYFAAAKLGLSLAVSVKQVTLIWPPTGLALATLLLFGYRLWPGIFIGAFAANAVTSEPATVALGIAFGNTLAAIAGTYLLNRFKFQRVFEQLTCIFKFLILGVLLSPMVSATLGSLSLVWSGLIMRQDYWHTWLTWWIGDGMGILIVTPLLLVWFRKENRILLRKNYQEAIILCLFIFAIGWYVFISNLTASARAYLVFPFIMWATIRFRQMGAASANFIIAFIAVWATTFNHGPFASPSVETSLVHSLLFMFVFTITALFASAVVTQGQQAKQQVLYQSYHDNLTDLPNRFSFEGQVNLMLEKMRIHKDPFAILMVDIDRFKLINDSLGHKSGDELLKKTAKRLEKNLPPDSILARMGGDEFVIATPEFEDADTAVSLSKKIIQAFQHPFLLDGQEIYSSVSLGIASYPHDGEDATSLLRNAYAALDRVKQTGRNSYLFYTRSLNAAAAQQLALETALRRAFTNGELEVHFWPQIEIDSGKIIKNEALLRWRHPTRGLIVADNFIHLAEITGLILPIGQWVMETAIQQTARWQKAGIGVGIAINVSALEFQRKDFVTIIKDLLKKSGLKPESVTLELTERILLENSESVVKTLNDLKDLGMQISIDDFNTGYSSLNYIKQFPIDTLKIDRSFVSGLPHKRDDCAIAKTIIDLGRSLKKNVVAEGVETMAQLRFLYENNCNRVQGYLFSEPIPAEPMEQILFQRKEWEPITKLKI
ncbi:MAG TPA: EAL domain-containing protein [Patescibacteria group bacterium]|nr:EAL domain-containing protein [Patescibacteria group bacterium]